MIFRAAALATLACSVAATNPFSHGKSAGRRLDHDDEDFCKGYVCHQDSDCDEGHSCFINPNKLDATGTVRGRRLFGGMKPECAPGMCMENFIFPPCYKECPYMKEVISGGLFEEDKPEPERDETCGILDNLYAECYHGAAATCAASPTDNKFFDLYCTFDEVCGIVEDREDGEVRPEDLVCRQEECRSLYTDFLLSMTPDGSSGGSPKDQWQYGAHLSYMCNSCSDKTNPDNKDVGSFLEWAMQDPARYCDYAANMPECDFSEGLYEFELKPMFEAYCISGLMEYCFADYDDFMMKSCAPPPSPSPTPPPSPSPTPPAP